MTEAVSSNEIMDVNETYEQWEDICLSSQEISDKTVAKDNERLVKSGYSLCIHMKQTIVNLNRYFRSNHPKWSVNQTFKEIAEAIKVSQNAIKRIVYEEKKHKTILPPKPKVRINNGYQFDINDRQVLITIGKELTAKTKTATIKQIFQFMRDNRDREDISDLKIKDCSYKTFCRLFKKMGLRLGQMNGKSVLFLNNMVKNRQNPSQEQLSDPKAKVLKSNSKLSSNCLKKCSAKVLKVNKTQNKTRGRPSKTNVIKSDSVPIVPIPQQSEVLNTFPDNQFVDSDQSYIVINVMEGNPQSVNATIEIKMVEQGSN